MKPIRSLSGRGAVITRLGMLMVFAIAVAGYAQAAAPLGPLPPPPKTNPKHVELGKSLFFDKRMSGDDDFACSNCHNPVHGWADGMPLAEAYPGTLSPRNAPTVLNTAYYKKMHWDGIMGDLETLVRTHATGAMFQNSDMMMLEERMRQIPFYQNRWKAAFGTEYVKGSRIFRAIAAYVKTLVSTDVPFDKYMKGDKSAMSSEAKNGLALFKGKANCVACHNGPLLTDEKYYNIGVPANPDILRNPLRHVGLRFMNMFLGVPGYDSVTQDYGRYIPSKVQSDKGTFRVPQLRELKYTAPYMHNGMLATLADVVEFYDQGGGVDSFTTKTTIVKPLGLSAKEKKALVAFLEDGLSSPQPIMQKPPPRPEYQLRAVKTWVPPKDTFDGGGVPGKFLGKLDK